MSLQLVEDALDDPRNATALAVASDLAYYTGDEGARGYREQLGMETRFFASGNTQVWVAGNDDHLVVAYRGTEAPTTFDGLKDWLLTDALNLLVLPEGRLGTDFAAAGVGTRFHLGFLNALADVWDPVLAAVEAEQERKERPLWITGHSLGGALALLSAWLFQRRYLSVHQIYTYGAPMVGNVAATQAFDRAFTDRVYRYVNTPDPVPKLPTMSLVANDYGHCQKEIALGTPGDVSNAIDLFKDLAGKAIDGLLNPTLIGDLWESIKSRAAAHALDSYRKQMQERFQTRG